MSPSPQLFFETINGFHRTEALNSAIDLGLFGALGNEGADLETLAERCGAAARGMRILCDYLTILGFLRKEGKRYLATPDTALFLDPKSPAYVGGATRFLLSPMLRASFSHLTDAVRQGDAAESTDSSLAPEHPMWVDFARAMAPITTMPARAMAELIPGDTSRPLKVLDVAAGHGVFGIAVAQRFPNARVVAQDWANVLQVAQENAKAAGVQDRVTSLPGSVFDIVLGSGYDAVLLTNILHHFDAPTCEKLLAKVRAALAPGGIVLTLEFVPNEDRVTPPESASFSLIMLAVTPRGDAYTYSEYQRMFQNAGYSKLELKPVPPAPQSLLIARV